MNGKDQAPANRPTRSSIAGGLVGGIRAGRSSRTASKKPQCRGLEIYTSIFSAGVRSNLDPRRDFLS
jgi:hypothetical protein